MLLKPKVKASYVSLCSSICRALSSLSKRPGCTPSALSEERCYLTLFAEDDAVNQSDLKHLTLIRHGESTYNQFRRAALQSLNLRRLFQYDPGLLDAELTAVGRSQARQVAEEKSVRTKAFDVIMSSPLSRGIDTALEIFFAHASATPKGDAEVTEQQAASGRPFLLVTPLLTEWLDTRSDSGLPLCALKSKYASYQQFIDWSTWETTKEWETGNWWFHNPEVNWLQSLYRVVAPEPRQRVDQRMNEFLKFLASRPESSICIVGHSWFFQALTGEPKFSNCEAREYVFDPRQRSLKRK